MPRLRQCNTSWAFHVPAPPTSVDAQHRRQTDTSTLVRRARHTDAAILSLAAVSGRHRLQAGCAPLPMPACMVWRHGIFPTTSSSSLISTASTSSRRFGDHAFPVAGYRLLNSLPSDITSAPTLTVFRNRLKTHLLSRSFSS